MSARAGWYTDPYGDPGSYRYWDGSQWSEHTGTNPQADAPQPADAIERQPDDSLNAPTRPPRRMGQPPQTGPAVSTDAQADSDAQATDPLGGRWRPGTWLIGSLVVLAGLLVAGALTLAFRPVSDERSANTVPATSTTDDRPVYPTSVPPGATTNPHGSICDAPTARPAPTQQPDDATVAAGGLAFPRLPEPWSQVTGEDRMSMSTDSVRQTAVAGEQSAATIRVARIEAGKGNSQPQVAAELASDCIMRTLYRNIMPAASVLRDQRIDVDGHEGWLRESVLDVSPFGPELDEEDERLIVVAVQVKPGQMAMYNATVPTSNPAYLNDAREALADLRVVA